MRENRCALCSWCVLCIQAVNAYTTSEDHPMSRPTFSLPTIASITDALYGEWQSGHAAATDHADMEDGDASDTYLDVRLWATSSERIGYPSSYGLEVGSSDYDQIHGDICSGDCIDLAAEPSRAECRKVARALLDDLRGQRAEFQRNYRETR